MQLTQEQFEELYHGIHWPRGLDDIVSDYSGRGMYGDTCLAFMVDDNGLSMLQLGWALAEAGLDFGQDIVQSHCRTDAMGLGEVVYFPGIQVDEE